MLEFNQEHVRALETQVNELLEQEKSENQRLNMMRDQAIKELQQVCFAEHYSIIAYIHLCCHVRPSSPRDTKFL